MVKRKGKNGEKKEKNGDKKKVMVSASAYWHRIKNKGEERERRRERIFWRDRVRGVRTGKETETEI